MSLTPEELAAYAKLTAAIDALTEVIRNLQFEKLGEIAYLSHAEAIDPERVAYARGEQIATVDAQQPSWGPEDLKPGRG